MTEDHDDFAFEPVPGLPEKLPRGETMLWQGSPEWWPLAVSTFHVRKLAVYFALLLCWEAVSAWLTGQALTEIAMLCGWVASLGAAAVGILCLLAYVYARGTIYTLTSKRIVIRTGFALPVTLNLPLSLIETASVRERSVGTGSIAMSVTKPNRIAWLVLWPNVKPWTFANPQPLLLCLPDAKTVASTLARALEADGNGQRLQAPARGATSQSSDYAPSGATMAA
ncbi:MAG: photosynthetic complex putative assembly protein PuhB [Hyphomicrobiales bacterium]|nr:photosynthetic complex putative assembly protein PuhB [Hyphomicrobiales bacterium]